MGTSFFIRVFRLSALAVLPALLLAACQSLSPVTSSSQIDFPPPDQVVTVAMGEPMAELRWLNKVEAIRFTSTYEPPPDQAERVYFRIAAGEIFPLRIYSQGRGPYAPETRLYIGYAEDLHRDNERRPALLSLLGEGFLMVNFVGENERVQLAEIEVPIYERIMVPMASEENFRRVLLYAGRRGSRIGLLYLEFGGDLANPDHSEDLSFDLADGNVITVRGARFEVIDATSWGITFKRLSDAAAADGVTGIGL